MSRFLLLGVLGCYLAAGQTTKVDLQNQTRGVDFSAATSTKPAKTGTALPSVCSTGEAYVLTTAVAGSNLYICTAANTWSVQSGQPGPTGPTGPTGPQGPQGPSGASTTTIMAGSGVPSASCAAPSTSNLGLYSDSTNQDVYVCVATNTWKRIFAGASGDAVEVTGAVQPALAAPVTGSVSCYFDNAALTWQCRNAAGTLYTSVKVAASRTTNQFVTHVGIDGVPVTAQPADTDLVMTASSTANDVSATTHGFVPIAPNDSTKALCGDGHWGTTCGGSGGYDPTDLTKKIVRETFCGSAIDHTSVGFGDLRWYLASGNSAPTLATVPPCGVTFSTAGGAADYAFVAMRGSSISVVPGTTPDWSATWKVSLGTTTNSTYYIGWNSNAESVGTYCPASGAANCIAWVYDSTVSGSEFRIVSCDSGSGCSSAASTITPVAGIIYTFTIRSVGTTVSAFVNAETPITVSTHLPGAAVAPGILLATNSSNAVVKSLTWKDFLFVASRL